MNKIAEQGFSVKKVGLSNKITSTIMTEGNLLTVDYNSPTGSDAEWKVYF